MALISGTVTDSSGAPLAGAAVKVFRRDTGELLQTATTVAVETEVLGDASYEAVELLLNFIGANGSSDFVDQSLSGVSLTAVGGVHIEVDGGSSYGLFSGAGCELAGAPVLAGTTPYTVEAWVTPTASTNYQTIFSTRVGSTGSCFGIKLGSNKIYVYSDSEGEVNSSHTFVVNTKVHVAWSFDGTNLRMFVDGVLISTTACILHHGDATRVGSGPFAEEENFTGKMHALRVTGSCRYTASFTPDPHPFPISSLPLTLAAGGYYAIVMYVGEIDVVCYALGGSSENDLVARLTLS
jgi:hypothetical protein